MAKLKLKNIDSLASELKNKFNGTQNSNLKIGIVACCDANSSKNYAYSLATIVEKEIFKNSWS